MADNQNYSPPKNKTKLDTDLILSKERQRQVNASATRSTNLGPNLTNNNKFSAGEIDIMPLSPEFKVVHVHTREANTSVQRRKNMSTNCNNFKINQVADPYKTSQRNKVATMDNGNVFYFAGNSELPK